MDQLHPIGTILSTHGYAGHLKIRLSKNELKDCNQLQSFFLLQKNKHIPYFIEHIRFTKDQEAIIKLEDYDTKEDAAHLKALEIFVHADELAEEAQTDPLADWSAYEVIDEQLGSLGKIQDVFEYPAQLMIQLHYKNEDKIIPLHEDFIVELDQDNYQIHVTLPEGILDI